MHRSLPERVTIFFLTTTCKEEATVKDPKDIALISIESVPEGMRPLGLVRGSTARSRNIARDITAGLKNLVGGEVMSYTKLMADAREEAIYRMQEDAARMGATMVVGVRFASSMVSQGVSEMVAWGTAVGPIDGQ
jgi:uncharacterized protein YbjQ (UPF0145 family)